MNVRGLCHLHSGYSRDASLNLLRLTNILQRKGYRFGIISDHFQDVDAARYQQLKAECRSLGEEVILIPGLEFELGNIHILGIGVREYFRPEGIADCLKKIKQQGGLSIWAHPSIKYLKEVRGSLEQFDGLEVWSARYGSKYAPSTALCFLVRNLRKRNKYFWGYAGLDAHKEAEIHDVYLEMEVENLSEQAVMRNLLHGDFNLGFGAFRVPADGRLSFWQKLVFPVLLSGYRLMDKVVDCLNK